MTPTTFENARQQIAREKLVLLYISMPRCSVCLAVKPRIEKLFAAELVQLQLDAAAYPEVAGTYQAMTAPVVLLFFNGKEVHRQARFIDFDKLAHVIGQYQAADTAISYEDLFQ